MNLKQYRPTSPGHRHRQDLPVGVITRGKLVEKGLLAGTIKKRGGRGHLGRITTRHQGGENKRRLRIIDWKRDKRGSLGEVVSIEYDPNRTANIALVHYPDGEKAYILAPENLTIGASVTAGEDVEIKVGNALPLEKIPIGTPIHNLELTPGKGGQMVRAAGQYALIQAKEGNFATVLLPSKEERLVNTACYATIGQVGLSQWKAVAFGKAGRNRHRGKRPTVRGVAMHPGAHPHGGGEGRSGIGMKSPKSPWGKKTLGKRTRSNKKYSDKYIIKRGR